MPSANSLPAKKAEKKTSLEEITKAAWDMDAKVFASIQAQLERMEKESESGNIREE